jgi:hypothetical protein
MRSEIRVQALFEAAINRWLADQKRQFSIKIPVQLAVGF